jgi:hypothetical protein
LMRAILAGSMAKVLKVEGCLNGTDCHMCLPPEKMDDVLPFVYSCISLHTHDNFTRSSQTWTRAMRVVAGNNFFVSGSLF